MFSDEQYKEKTSGDKSFLVVAGKSNNLDSAAQNVSVARPGC